MRELEDTLRGFLSEFLKEHLPRLSARWWEELVVDALTGQQRQIFIVEGRASSLDDLDLAAVLQVLLKNWGGRDGLSNLLQKPFKVINLIGEAKEARNIFIGHVTGNSPSPDDRYRSIDTYYRLFKIFDASKSILSQIDAVRQESLQLIKTDVPKDAISPKDDMTPELSKNAMPNWTGKEWAYFATGTQANAQKTLNLAEEKSWIWRTAFGSSGQAIANTKHVSVGDIMYLCFNQKVLSTFEIIMPDRILERFNGMGVIPDYLSDYLESIKYNKDPKLGLFTGFHVKQINDSGLKYSYGGHIPQQGRNSIQKIN